MSVNLVCFVEVWGADAVDVPVLFTVTAESGQAIYSRTEGTFSAARDPAAPEDMPLTTPLVVDLTNVSLPKPGIYQLTATIADEPPQVIHFDVVGAQPSLF